MDMAIFLAAASLSAIIGASTGIGGGVILLISLAYVANPLAIVPVHGCVQTFSCLTRLVVFKRFIDWNITLRFWCGVLPGTLLSAFIANHVINLNPSYILLLISFYVLYFVFSINKKQRVKTNGTILTTSFLCGFLGVFVGSTGTIVSAWLLENGYSKENHIATKSAMQTFAHLIKVTSFIFIIGFNFSDYVFILICMFACVFICTFIGKKILSYLDENTFFSVVRLILFLISLNIIIQEVPKIL